MNRDRVIRGVTRAVQFTVFAMLFLIVFTFVVRALWNWLMPALFGLHVITIWQALGILVLSKILFGGFRGGSHRGGWRSRRRIIERWEKMTPEEREKFRQGMRGRCGPFGAPVDEPTP
jgi:Ca2+/H+ antiporter, TMEM165/GDT1 family